MNGDCGDCELLIFHIISQESHGVLTYTSYINMSVYKDFHIDESYQVFLKKSCLISFLYAMFTDGVTDTARLFCDF